jgi:hypothetical protein
VLSDIWEFDQNTVTWTQLATPTYANAARHGHSETFLSAYPADIFGGFNSVGTELNDYYGYTPPATYATYATGPTAGRHCAHYAAPPLATAFTIYRPQAPGNVYSFSGGAWTTTATSGISPTPVDYTACAYRRRAATYFGFACGGEVIATGVETTQCTAVAGGFLAAMASLPAARKKGAMGMYWTGAVDYGLFFGGVAGDSVQGSTYRYTLQGNTWATMTPTGQPQARQGHAICFFPPSATDVWMFGGIPNAAA